MSWIVKTSLQYRFLILIAAGILVVFGVTRLTAMPVDVLPEFSPPYVEIQTEALGLSAEEVEQLITVPLEQDLLNGVAWLDVIRSESVPGLSSIVLVFEPGTDLYRARQLVSERLTQAFALPHVSKPPTMLQPKSATSRVMIVGLSSDSLSLIQMSVLARWTIAPRLMGVPGVSNVAIWGFRDRQLQVRVDPERLRAHDVTLLQVLETTGNALWVSSLSFLEASTPGNAGFIDTPQQRLGIQHILPIVSPEELAQVPVEGSRVRLTDVANVVEDHQPLIGDALTPKGTSLLLVVDKFPGTNTLQVSRDIEQALDSLKPGMTGMQMDSTIYRPATFIELAMDNLSRALLIGAVIVILLLGLFFFEWRSALISVVAISLSLLTGGLVLYLQNATMNVMILAGFMIAIAVVVDDAIVSVENVLRRLQQANDTTPVPLTADVVAAATLEMRGPLLFATFIVLLAALPMFFLEGLSGAFFQPLVTSYIAAVLASFVVSLTITPALCLILWSSARAPRRGSPLVRGLQAAYARGLGGLVAKPRAAFAVVVILLLLGVAMLPLLGITLLPTFQEPSLVIQLEGAPGISQPEMSRIVAQVSNELRNVAGVRNVGGHIGRAVFGDQVVGINSAELWVNLAPDADTNETIVAIQQIVDGYPGLERNVQTYLQATSGRIVQSARDPLTVRMYGNDYGILGEQAEKVRQALSQIGGVAEAHVILPRQEPTLEIEVNLEAAQRYGIKPGDVRRAAATLLNGLQVGNLFEEQKIFEVVVWSTPQTRASISDVRALLIDAPNGQRIRLGDVADVRVKSAAAVVRHDNVSRYLDIGATVQGRDVGAVRNDANAALKQIAFPLEYHAELVSDYAERQAADQRLLIAAAIVVLGTFLLLQAGIQSWRMALVCLLLLPLTFVGGLVAAFASGGILTLGSLAGLVAVFAIAARNMLLMVTHYQRLEQAEGESFGAGLVLRGARERFAPIVMTMVSVLGLAPIVFMGDVPGLEIVRPMAIVIIGGFVTATLVNLFIVPPLYLIFGRSVAATNPAPKQLSDEPAAL